MNANYINFLLDELAKKQIKIEAGLSDEEVGTVEAVYGFHFPPDLRLLLQRGLPTSQGFPDWRSGERDVIHSRLNWPLDGILFDVEHNAFWLSDWGERPTNLGEAKRIATANFSEAPKLIPVYRHRFLPAEPLLPGNPVYSVHQTDIIYYGFDLPDYFLHEFNIAPLRETRIGSPREVRFWSLLAS